MGLLDSKRAIESRDSNQSSSRATSSYSRRFGGTMNRSSMLGSKGAARAEAARRIVDPTTGQDVTPRDLILPPGSDILTITQIRGGYGGGGEEEGASSSGSSSSMRSRRSSYRGGAGIMGSDHGSYFDPDKESEHSAKDLEQELDSDEDVMPSFADGEDSGDTLGGDPGLTEADLQLPVAVILSETPTFAFFEMVSTTCMLDSDEGQRMRAQNDRYVDDVLDLRLDLCLSLSLSLSVCVSPLTLFTHTHANRGHPHHTLPYPTLGQHTLP